MTVEEIMKRCDTLTIAERRMVSADYSEFVFFHKDAEVWENLFTELLGGAIKAAGKKPSKDDSIMTEVYGGIRSEQTLFLKHFDDVSVMVMFWPWKDITHITAKIVLTKNGS
jgi:hypothetical protein